MRHKVTVKKLSKTPAHRKAMFRNMLIALFRHESIQTTHAKSKVLKRFAEKIITRSGIDRVHNRREVAKMIHDKEILNKLFTEIGPKYRERPGGYTRTVKLGPRYGDATEMVQISLVEETIREANNSKPSGKASTKTRSAIGQKQTSKIAVTKKQDVSENTEIKELSGDSEIVSSKEAKISSSVEESGTVDNAISDEVADKQE